MVLKFIFFVHLTEVQLYLLIPFLPCSFLKSSLEFLILGVLHQVNLTEAIFMVKMLLSIENFSFI